MRVALGAVPVDEITGENGRNSALHRHSRPIAVSAADDELPRSRLLDRLGLRGSTSSITPLTTSGLLELRVPVPRSCQCIAMRIMLRTATR
jgi:hypothetical protein